MYQDGGNPMWERKNTKEKQVQLWWWNHQCQENRDDNLIQVCLKLLMLCTCSDVIHISSAVCGHRSPVHRRSKNTGGFGGRRRRAQRLCFNSKVRTDQHWFSLNCIMYTGRYNEMFCCCRGVLQSLIEKHFPAPDRRKLYSLLGIDLLAKKTPPPTETAAQLEQKGKKRKGTEGFITIGLVLNNAICLVKRCMCCSLMFSKDMCALHKCFIYMFSSITDHISRFRGKKAAAEEEASQARRPVGYQLGGEPVGVGWRVQ